MTYMDDMDGQYPEAAERMRRAGASGADVSEFLEYLYSEISCGVSDLVVIAGLLGTLPDFKPTHVVTSRGACKLPLGTLVTAVKRTDGDGGYDITDEKGYTAWVFESSVSEITD